MSKWELVRLGDVCEGKSSNIAQKDLVGNEGLYPIYGASGLIKNVDFYKYEQEYIAVIKDGAGIGRTIMCEAKSSVIGTMQALIPNESIDYRYMFYAVSRMGLSKYYTGATIPHIYFKDYKDEKIPLPPVDIQKKITAALDTANALIEKRKEQIEKLDLLIKSQFIEMFGDPVTNPKGWEKKQLSKLIVHANNGMARRGNDIDGDIVLRLVELQDGFLDYSKPNRILLSEFEKKRYLLFKNDFLFARVNGNPDYVGRCAVFHDIGEDVYYNDHIIRVRFDDSQLQGCFVSTLLNSQYGKKQMRSKIKTSAGQYTISQDGIGAIEIICPPLYLQTQFAEFVQKVEAQKTLLQKSLADMEQNYQSLLQKCFKGEIF